MKSTHVLTAAIAIVSSLVTFAALQYWGPKPVTYQIDTIPASTSPVLYSKTTSGTFAPLDFTGVSAQVTDAVVHIKSSSSQPKRQSQNPWGDLFGDSPFGDLFPQQPRQQQSPRGMLPMGSGSGVIISSDGYIVTNNHVIDKAEEIEIVLNDNRTYQGTVIGTDPTTDLALVKIDATDLDHLSFADSDVVQTGQWVLAVGNPYDLTSTVTAGIVSATGRSINILREKYAIESFIQTDAAINPGNSGGALVNLDGQLVGINTAISSPTGSYSGYGFAVPANLVSKVITDLREYGNVQRGVLGVMIRNVDNSLAIQKDLDLTYGVYVDSLLDKSAAKASGIEVGDVIVAVDGKDTPASPILQEAIANKRPGDIVKVKVNRNGQEQAFDVELRNRKGTTKIVKPEDMALTERLGIQLAELDEEEADKLNVSSGVVVTALDRGLITRDTDMQSGFVITRVDGDPVKNIKDFERKLKDRKGGIMLEGVYPGETKPRYYAFGM